MVRYEKRCDLKVEMGNKMEKGEEKEDVEGEIGNRRKGERKGRVRWSTYMKGVVCRW